ncbi:MAG: gamma carbonic anhydrase family protein [Xanthomonadales bacterium]|nr:gamma carbonic anhydrase family protein [Xanthomonadales bacterium]
MNIRPFLDRHPVLAAGVYVDPAAHVIGEVSMGADSSVWPMAVVRGDVNRISIGARSNIQDGAIIHVTHDGPYTPGGIETVIGDDVTIGHGAIIHACTIENACLIGMGATVMDGAIVRRHGFVAAGAVLPPGKEVGSGELWLGNPARLVRHLNQEQIEALYYSASHYVRLKDRYLGMTP